VPTIFPIYYAEVELYDRSKHCANLARPTRTDCLFLDKPYRVEWLGYFWVVVLLSPAWSSLGLGSYYFTLCHVVTLLVVVTSLLVCRIGIWGDGIGTAFGGFQ
jgi:hypothetical protein